MKNSTLKLIKNEFKTHRVLPKQEPKPLNPPQFEVELINFWNPNLKWFFSIIKYWG